MPTGPTFVLRWEEPPPPRPPYRHPVGDERRDWRAIVEELRDHPDRWALVGDQITSASANAIRQRINRWGSKGEVEVTVRDNRDGTCRVYARARLRHHTRRSA